MVEKIEVRVGIVHPERQLVRGPIRSTGNTIHFHQDQKDAQGARSRQIPTVAALVFLAALLATTTRIHRWRGINEEALAKS